MQLIVIQDSAVNPAYAEVFGNVLANSTGFLANKAKVKKDTVIEIQLSGNELYIDVFYGHGKNITLDPKGIQSVNGEENTGYAWTASELYDKLCAYLNI
jgi:hypothetical protein